MPYGMHRDMYIYIQTERERADTSAAIKIWEKEGDSVSHHRSEVQNWIAY